MTSPLAPLPGAAPAGGLPEGEPSLLLHRWRRLDWRFLVPSVEWTRIACAGAVDDELRAALPLVAPQVHEPTTAADWSALSGTCDVVVLVAPTPAQVQLAVTALRPGGWVYAEVRRTLRLSGPRSLLGWRRAFVHAGLDRVEAHWHAPGLTDTQRVVSVDATTAVRHALGGQGGLSRRVRAVVTEVLLRCRLFPVAVPEGSVVGRRPLLAS